MTNSITTFYHLRRGCGYRQPGKIYVHSNPSVATEDPLDLDWMLMCPVWHPWIESPKEMGIAALGMKILERAVYDAQGELVRTGIWDLYDWISEEDYPYFPDFFEEGRNWGTSRKASESLPFRLLNHESKHLFLHRKAYLADPGPIAADLLDLKKCPAFIDFHDHPDVANGVYDNCTAYLWQAVDPYPEKGNPDRIHTVELPRHRPDGEQPSCTYHAGYLPKGYEPVWHPAVVMWAPIDDFEVVKDDLDGTHQKALDLLASSGTDIPYTLVGE